MRYARYPIRAEKSERQARPADYSADFVIGAQRLLQADRLITFDGRVIADFPDCRSLQRAATQ